MNTDRNGNRTFYLEVAKVTRHTDGQYRVLFRDQPNSIYQDWLVNAATPDMAAAEVCRSLFLSQAAMTGDFDGTV